jgi:hypothetical protein
MLFSEISGQTPELGAVLAYDGGLIAVLAWWDAPDGGRRAFLDDAIITYPADSERGEVIVELQRPKGSTIRTYYMRDAATAIQALGLTTKRCDGIEGLRRLGK